MSIKKILLLAGMALALAALATPVAAQADPMWYDDEFEQYLPENQHVELHAEGELTFDVSGLKVGPCQTTVTGLAENHKAMASGAITNSEIQNECETNVAGCTAKPTVNNLPWEVTGSTITGKPSLEIYGMTFLIHFIGTCPVPVTTIAAEGIGTPTSCVPECLTFEGHSDDLLLEILFPVSVDITGVLYLKAPLTLGSST